MTGDQAGSGAGRISSDELEASLCDALPGLTIVDRAFEVSPGTEADLVGIDGAGRLVLVLGVPGDGEEPVLAGLDALAFARANLELVARHLGSERLRLDLPPYAVLVSDAFTPRVLERLAPLLGPALRLFEVRALRSARAAATYLVPPAPAAPPLAAAEVADGAFLASLPEAARELAHLVAARMGRVDASIECRATAEGLHWAWRGQPICSLAGRPDLPGGALEGHLEHDPATRLLEDARHVDELVDGALGRLVELAGIGHPGDVPLDDVELVPAERPVRREDPGMLLTPEEIEAFRE